MLIVVPAVVLRCYLWVLRVAVGCKIDRLSELLRRQTLFAFTHTARHVGWMIE